MSSGANGGIVDGTGGGVGVLCLAMGTAALSTDISCCLASAFLTSEDTDSESDDDDEESSSELDGEACVVVVRAGCLRVTTVF